MRYLNLWCTELPPIIDVMRGPINGAAQRDEATGTGQRTEPQCPSPSGIRQAALQDNPAAAPPEPTPADSEGANFQATPSHEGPGTEREGEAWVPWGGEECPPVPETTPVLVKWRQEDPSPLITAGNYDWRWLDEDSHADIIAYRLANPTPRGPCLLPADHPHAALERLYMSDDTLRCWARVLGSTKWIKLYEPQFDMRIATYHVGHVPPKEAA